MVAIVFENTDHMVLFALTESVNQHFAKRGSPIRVSIHYLKHNEVDNTIDVEYTLLEQ